MYSDTVQVENGGLLLVEYLLDEIEGSVGRVAIIGNALSRINAILTGAVIGTIRLGVPFADHAHVAAVASFGPTLTVSALKSTSAHVRFANSFIRRAVP